MLVEFVDIWKRCLRKAPPIEVIDRLQHGEDRLHPFYAHLRETHDRLRQVLKDGK